MCHCFAEAVPGVNRCPDTACSSSGTRPRGSTDSLSRVYSTAGSPDSAAAGAAGAAGFGSVTSESNEGLVAFLRTRSFLPTSSRIARVPASPRRGLASRKHAGVAALAIGEARGDIVEEDLHRLLVTQQPQRPPPARPPPARSSGSTLSTARCRAMPATARCAARCSAPTGRRLPAAAARGGRW